MRILFIVLHLLIFTKCFAVNKDADNRNAIIVSRGTADVRLSDVDAYMNKIPEGDRAGFINSAKRVEIVLNNLLLEKQLAAEARKFKLDKDDSVMSQVELETVKILARERIKRYEQELKFPQFESLAKEKYLAEKSLYVVPAMRDVRHILITTKERDDEKASKLANQLRDQALVNPESFIKLIELYSEDPSKSQNQGLFSNINNDDYDRAFAEATSKLSNLNEISPVVKSSFGYHIIQLVKYTAEKQQNFEEVRDSIVANLKEKFIENSRREYLNKLTGETMDANPDLVASLRERYGAVPIIDASSTNPEALQPNQSNIVAP